MLRAARKIPTYCLHRPSGQARVIIGGRHIYLGEYGSPESQEKYARLIAESAASAMQGLGESDAFPGNETAYANPIFVVQLCAAYLGHCEKYYSSSKFGLWRLGDVRCWAVVE